MQLEFQLLFRQRPAFQPVAGLHHFFDVEVEDVAAAKLAGRPFAPSQKESETPAALAERQRDFLLDFVVVGDGFLGFACKRHPHRGHMHEDHHRAARQRAARLRNAVMFPGRAQHRLEGRTGGLLIEERHAVRVADDARKFRPFVVSFTFGLGHRRLLRFDLLVRTMAVGQAGFNDKWIAAIDGRRPADGGVKFAFNLFVQPREDRLLADR